MNNPLQADASGLGITRKAWHGLLDQLIELEGAGALDGIRAIVAERLGQVRNGRAGRGITARVASAALQEVPAESFVRSYSVAAAILAAEIDRKGKP
jgi:hypothetical protein